MDRQLNEEFEGFCPDQSSGGTAVADEDAVLVELRLDPATRSSTPPARHSRRCPHCDDPVAADSIICVHCGFNARTQQFVRTRVATGQTMRGDAARPARQAEAARAAVAMLWPVTLLSLGLLGRALAGTTLLERSDMVDPLYLSGLAVSTLIGLSALWVVARASLGGFGHLHLALLRLAAAYAVVDAVAVLVAPIVAIGLIVMVLTFAGLLARFWDMRFQDAFAVAALMLLLKICVFLALGIAIFP